MVLLKSNTSNPLLTGLIFLYVVAGLLMRRPKKLSLHIPIRRDQKSNFYLIRIKLMNSLSKLVKRLSRLLNLYLIILIQSRVLLAQMDAKDATRKEYARKVALQDFMNQRKLIIRDAYHVTKRTVLQLLFLQPTTQALA